MSYAAHSREKAGPAQKTASPKTGGRALRVAEPHDHYEREADRAADAVMSLGGQRMGWSLSAMGIDVPLQRKCSCEGPGAAQCEDCKKKEPLHRRAIDATTPSVVPPIVYEVLNSPGSPLDQEMRSFFEPRFGHDLGRVRLHTDSRAAESARAVHAHAWTVGQDIIFAVGKYAPHTAEGRKLLAHELAHTVQQRAVLRPAAGLSAAKDVEYQGLERDAGAAATAAAAGRPARVARPAPKAKLSREDGAQPDPNAQPDPTVVKASSKKEKPGIPGSAGPHTVKPTELLGVKDSTGNNAVDAIEEFLVAPFYLPEEKGPDAFKIYDNMKGKSLEALLELRGPKRAKTALWQLRPDTQDLRELWFQKVGCTKATADDLWKTSGGDKEFPKIGGESCQMDHIVELQIGGNNPPENIQPLDAKPNRDSGGFIRRELESLALAIHDDTDLSSQTAKQIKMRFTEVKQLGSPKELRDCPATDQKPTCLEVEKCAKKKQAAKPQGQKPGGETADYAITAGGRLPTILKTPVSFGTKAGEEVVIEGFELNDSASTLIPGLLLTKLVHTAKKPNADVIYARIDDREKTRLPLSLDKNSKTTINLNVQQTTDPDGKKVGDLKLDPQHKGTGLAFTYKYLSPGKITDLGVDEKGETTWKGTIRPNFPFFGELGVEYGKGELKVTKGLKEEDLKKRKVLGMKLTKAQLELVLAPELKAPNCVIEMQLGSDKAPLATAAITKLSVDTVGPIVEGTLKVNIPKMQTAESNISYKGGPGRSEWYADVHIKSDAIKLGPVSVDGQFDGKIENGDITFTGAINVVFPGDNSAKLGLKKEKDDWVLFGDGTFKVPKLEDKLKPITVKIHYSLMKEQLVATGKTGFTIPAINLSGDLDEATIVLGKDLSFDNARISGKGGLKFERGKAKGELKVELHPNRKFTGTGSLSYQLKPNLIITGTVELNDKEKLHVKGELLLTRYELFGQRGDSKDLFPPLDVPIGIPGLSIGTSGLVFHIRGGIKVGYSFGPGLIEPLKFTAEFDPLEKDPKAEFAVTGTAKVGASATLSAFITGSLAVQVDVFVGSAGAEGGLKLQGDLTLSAGAFATLDAAYKDHKLSAKIVAGLKTQLLLGISLTAFARAWAGAFGISGEVRKDWTLAQKTIDTGIGFEMSAPFEYAEDTGVKLPELKDVTFKKPELNFSHILDQVFGSAQKKEKKD